MKTMTCSQLGGPSSCNQEFQADTWEQMGELSKKHAMDMVQKQDGDHLEAMGKMKNMMEKGEAEKWMEEKKQEFDSLPEDN